MAVTCGCERNALGTIEKLCADHSFAEQRRCHGLIKRAEDLEGALYRLVCDVNAYEEASKLAPNPGRMECWDSVAHAKRLLANSER